MKDLLIVAAIFLIAVNASAQKTKKESFYAYDSQWGPSELAKASYLAYVEELDDTTFRWNFYHINGPLLTVETYKDKDSKIPNGFFAWYDANGKIDSSGNALSGKRDGTWYVYSDALVVVTEMIYEDGVLLKTIDHNPNVKERVDSLPGDKEANFKGGFAGWSKYLEKNIQFPDRALNLNKYGKVMVDFIVDSTGKVSFSKITTSVEYSLDREAVRLIEGSPDWIPAIRMGKRVTAFRRQPITFAKPE